MDARAFWKNERGKISDMKSFHVNVFGLFCFFFTGGFFFKWQIVNARASPVNVKGRLSVREHVVKMRKVNL